MTGSQSINGQPGRYNSSLPTLNDGQGAALAVDINGKLLVSGGGSSGNAAASATGAAVPASADYQGLNVSGTLRGQTGVNPSGSIFAGQVDVASINGVTPLMGNGVTGTGSLRVTIASDNTAFSVNASGTKTNNNAAPGATNVGALTGLANAAVPTWTEGNEVLASMDLSGNQRTTLGTLIAGEDLTNNKLVVEQRNSYLNIAAGQATTVVKSGAGFLHSITFNSAATATNTTTVYDNTAASGTVIAIPAATTATVPTTLTYDVSFATGLTIITATANGSNMTVSYR